MRIRVPYSPGAAYSLSSARAAHISGRNRPGCKKIDRDEGYMTQHFVT